MVYLNWRDAAGEVLKPRQDDPAQDTSTEDDTTRKVSPVGTFFIVLFVLLLIGGVGWVVFTQLRARRLGVSLLSLSSSPSTQFPYLRHTLVVRLDITVAALVTHAHTYSKCAALSSKPWGDYLAMAPLSTPSPAN